MKLSELFMTAKGRRATAKLAIDVTRITGKAAISGVSAVAVALASAENTNHSDDSTEDSRMFSFGKVSDGIGGVHNRNT